MRQLLLRLVGGRQEFSHEDIYCQQAEHLCSTLDHSMVLEGLELNMQDPEMFGKLPEPTDDENDMLDLAYGLTDTWEIHLLQI